MRKKIYLSTFHKFKAPQFLIEENDLARLEAGPDDIIIEGASGKDKPDPGKDKPPDPGKDKGGASVEGYPACLEWFYDLMDQHGHELSEATMDQPSFDSDKDLCGPPQNQEAKSERAEHYPPTPPFWYESHPVTIYRSDGTRERAQEWCPPGEPDSPKCFYILEDGTWEQ